MLDCLNLSISDDGIRLAFENGANQIRYALLGILIVPS